MFILECLKCTRYGVYRKYNKNIIEPTSQGILAVHQRHSTIKFCKSCEVMIMYMVVLFTTVLNEKKKEKKGMVMYIYIKIQSRLQQSTSSLLHFKTYYLWRQTGVHRRARGTQQNPTKLDKQKKTTQYQHI